MFIAHSVPVFEVEGKPLHVGDILWTTCGEITQTQVEAILMPSSATSNFWNSPEGGVVFRFGEASYEVWPDLGGLCLSWRVPPLPAH